MEAVELEEIAHLTFDAIFNDVQEIEYDGMVYEMGRTSSSKLRKFTIKGLNFLEQNPRRNPNGPRRHERVIRLCG